MLPRWVGRAAAIVPLASAGAAGLCELTERADDAEKPAHAARQLLALRTAATAAATRPDGEQEQQEPWLNAETPQFPYLLAVSAGDDPRAVVDG